MEDEALDDIISYGRLDSGKKLLDTLQCLLPTTSSTMKSTGVEAKFHPTSEVRFTTVIPGIFLNKSRRSSFVGFQAIASRVQLNLWLLTHCFALPSLGRPIPMTLAITRGSMRVTHDDDSGLNTDCMARTMEDGCNTFHAMRSISRSKLVASAIMSSEILRDGISELHCGGSEYTYLKVSPQVPCIVLMESSLNRKGNQQFDLDRRQKIIHVTGSSSWMGTGHSKSWSMTLEVSPTRKRTTFLEKTA